MAGGIAAVAQAMAVHAADLAVQREGLRCVMFACARHDGNKGIAGESGAVEACIAALTAFGADEKVALFGCNALLNMCTGHAGNKERIGDRGGVIPVCSVLEVHPAGEDINYAALWVLLNMTIKSPRNQERIVRSGGLTRIILAMARHGGMEKLQLMCIRLVMQLSLTEEAAVAAMKAGALGGVVNAMRSYPDNRQLQHDGLFSLFHLAGDVNNKEQLGRGGAIAAAVHCMRCAPRDKELLATGIKLLTSLYIKCSSNKSRLGEEGAVEAAVRVMKEFMSDAAMLVMCVRLLQGMSVKHAENKKLIGRKAAIDTTIVAMQRHRRTLNVQAICCRLLVSLSMEDHNARLMGRKGAIKSLLLSITAHIGDASLVASALWALDNLAVANPWNQARIVQDRGLPPLVRCMLLHKTNRDVQSSAVRIMTNICVGDRDFRYWCAEVQADVALAAVEGNFAGDEELISMSAALLSNVTGLDMSAKPIGKEFICKDEPIAPAHAMPAAIERPSSSHGSVTPRARPAPAPIRRDAEGSSRRLLRKAAASGTASVERYSSGSGARPAASTATVGTMVPSPPKRPAPASPPVPAPTRRLSMRSESLPAESAASAKSTLARRPSLAAAGSAAAAPTRRPSLAAAAAFGSSRRPSLRRGSVRADGGHAGTAAASAAARATAAIEEEEEGERKEAAAPAKKRKSTLGALPTLVSLAAGQGGGGGGARGWRRPSRTALPAMSDSPASRLPHFSSSRRASRLVDIPSDGSTLLKGTWKLYDKVVAEGGMHKIRRAVHSMTREVVAAKLYESPTEARRELHWLQRFLRSDCVVDVRDCVENFDGAGTSCLLMEAGRGDAATYVKMQHSVMTAQDKFALMLRLAECVKAVHDQGLVHGDIKLENLVQFKDGMRTVWKLVDFDCARRPGEPLTKFTPACAPPEMADAVLHGRKELTADASYDVWSFGICVLQIYLGCSPWEAVGVSGDGAVLGKLRSMDPVELLEDPRLPPEDSFHRLLMNYILFRDPKQRKTMTAILKQSWLSPHSITATSVMGAISAVGDRVSRAERTVLDAMEALHTSYPSVFFMLPKRKTMGESLLSIMQPLETLLEEEHVLHLLCECEVEADGTPAVLWHRTQHDGYEVKNPRRFVAKTARQLIVPLKVLSGAASVAAALGFPLPAVPDGLDLVDKARQHLQLDSIIASTDDMLGDIDDDLEERRDDTDILRRDGMRPRRAEGDALMALKAIVGEVDSKGLLGQLHPVLVKRSGPMGEAGRLYWLCEKHAELLRRWNETPLMTDTEYNLTAESIMRDSMRKPGGSSSGGRRSSRFARVGRRISMRRSSKMAGIVGAATGAGGPRPSQACSIM
eukprot:PLAT11077.1.p1 GENE.PLAT11077.1~~PLAT11077.1.p1  ORF type:complete len:1403 (-),score=634.28 PLAT11077.1:73-4116(-)